MSQPSKLKSPMTKKIIIKYECLNSKRISLEKKSLSNEHSKAFQEKRKSQQKSSGAFYITQKMENVLKNRNKETKQFCSQYYKINDFCNKNQLLQEMIPLVKEWGLNFKSVLLVQEYLQRQRTNKKWKFCENCSYNFISEKTKKIKCQLITVFLASRQEILELCFSQMYPCLKECQNE